MSMLYSNGDGCCLLFTNSKNVIIEILFKIQSLGDKTLLQYILLQHVAPEKLRSTDLKSGMTIKTLADNSMTILDTKDGLTFAGALFFSGGLNQVATNGIIHAIEDVVYPYVSEEQATTPRPSINR